jgi:fructose 1,6-bisphosphatase
VNHYGKLLESVIYTTLNRTLAREQHIPYRIEMHAFLVMYNIWMGAPCSRMGAIMALIQEVKRNIVYRRYTRETTKRAINCNCARLLARLLTTVKKLEILRRYQGKNNTFFTEVRLTIADMMLKKIHNTKLPKPSPGLEIKVMPGIYIVM